MFPPMTPYSERKRAESELEVLEREAMWHAHLEREANRVSLFQRLSNLLARVNRQPQPAVEPRRVTATQEIAATSGC
jgi:hypothetical protein